MKQSELFEKTTLQSTKLHDSFSDRIPAPVLRGRLKIRPSCHPDRLSDRIRLNYR